MGSGDRRLLESRYEDEKNTAEATVGMKGMAIKAFFLKTLLPSRKF